MTHDELMARLVERVETQVAIEVARERIVRAAITIDDGVWSVPAPMRHHHAVNLYVYGSAAHPPADDAIDKRCFVGDREEQGFVTSTGRFVSREEAWPIALAAGQIVRRVGGDEGRLYSENLW